MDIAYWHLIDEIFWSILHPSINFMTFLMAALRILPFVHFRIFSIWEQEDGISQSKK